MRGVDRNTGKALFGLDHLRQSITDILTTPLGSRVMRRDYGSELPSLVDAPLNQGTIALIYNATFTAILRWEPRVRPLKVQANIPRAGSIELFLECIYAPTGEVFQIDGLKI